MLSVVIPALNEEQAIGQTLDRISEVLSKIPNLVVELVVVDDGSTDNTGAIARGKGAKVIRHLQNAGYGRSLKDGIAAASYDTIVIIDADGTYPIELIPTLLETYQQGFDMVVGQRRGKHYEESWIKLPLRWLLRAMVEFTSGQRIPDINSGLRVFSRSTVLTYFDQLCNTFSFTTSQTLAYLLTGRYVTYVPIDYHARVGKAKVRLLKDSLRTLQYIVQAILFYNPLKIFLLVAIVFACLGGTSIVASAFANSFSLLLAALTFLGLSGVTLTVGLLSDQLRQVLVAIHGRNVAGRTTFSQVKLVEQAHTETRDQKASNL